MASSEDILEVDLELLEYDPLLEAAKSFRKGYKDCLSEKAKQQEELKRLQADFNNQRTPSFPSSTTSIDSKRSWIRAELDSPGDTSWSCLRFRERSKYPTVAVYDQSRSSLEARSRETLKGERAVIYSRLPSRRTKAIHVFVECVTTLGSDSTRNFRISTKKQTPPGFVPHCTIHLERLSWEARVKIWTGHIKWLYILRDLESHRDSSCARLREK